jgi:group I intron endonuclease
MMVIYKTTNLVNGKYYIGKQKVYTKSYFGSGMALKHAIKKYGKQNFKKEILEECQSEEELKNKELWWLDSLDAIKDKNCYNLVRETSSNNHRSYDDPEYRKRLSMSITKMLNTPESKARLKMQNGGRNNPMYGKRRTDDFKRKISKINSGKVVSAETKEKIRMSKLGISLSDETKVKMKNSQKKRWDTIVIEVDLGRGIKTFDHRDDFLKFLRQYNRNVPVGRVRGKGKKRVNWKRALNNGYDFITVTPKISNEI